MTPEKKEFGLQLTADGYMIAIAQQYYPDGAKNGQKIEDYWNHIDFTGSIISADNFVPLTYNLSREGKEKIVASVTDSSGELANLSIDFSQTGLPKIIIEKQNCKDFCLEEILKRLTPAGFTLVINSMCVPA